MFDDSVSTVYSSIWASMNSWFTPTVLFVLLNVMIATIAFTSSLANQKQNHHLKQQQEDHSQQQQQQQPTKLTRSPSLLQRIKSINFHNFRSQEPVKDYNFDQSHQQQETPFEPPTRYIFEPAPEHTTTQPDTTHYIFNQENIQKTQTQYDFQQTHQENLQETQTQYLFQHTHEQPPLNIDQDFNFNPTHQQKHENMDQNFNFNPTHEQKHENMKTHFDFQYTHEQKPLNMDKEFNFNPTHEPKHENIKTHFDFQYTHKEKHENTNTHFDIQQIQEENEDEEEGELKSLDEVYSQLRERHVSRSRSDTKPSSGEAPAKLPTKMKKSASMKSPFPHFEEEAIVEARRPVTTKERSGKTSDGDNEVDAKADDFINKFKQQLKLQRLDSILRYKEMIGRGS
ncbi:hypothetical protein RND71_028859 [Anisodus tanguticus]|uniref:DUF4408 domain-containing protein n=1 Tax=Anisodus tanguticus TaxID=243964 RepID=A0AAE1RKJ0_9SOLA|nr:hypothetical protein RND71_028859 [Anisodus tanguticus]